MALSVAPEERDDAQTTSAQTPDLTPEQDAQFWDYVTHAAQFMINTMEDLQERPGG